MVLLVLIRGGFDLVSEAREDLLEEMKKFHGKRRACAKIPWHDGTQWNETLVWLRAKGRIV